MVADGHLTPPPPLPGWNAGASFLTKKETPIPAIKLKLYASDDVITKLEDLGDGLGNFRGLRGVVRCDPENGDVRICGIPVVYDPDLDSPKETPPMPFIHGLDPKAIINDLPYPQSLRPMQTSPDAVQPTPETDPYANLRFNYNKEMWECKDCGTPLQTRLGENLGIPVTSHTCPATPTSEIDQVIAQSETVASDVPRQKLTEDGHVVEGIVPNNVRFGMPDRRAGIYPRGKYQQYPNLLERRRQSAGRRAGDPDYVKPCGCLQHANGVAQECVRCCTSFDAVRVTPRDEKDSDVAQTLTSGLRVNINSALRRKIRAEIIEEVTRFLTGDDG